MLRAVPAEVAHIPPPMPYPPSRESASSGGASSGPRLPVCANCGQELTGPFCSQCGQHVADFHRSIWRFALDFVDNLFCWDSKVLRTLEPLIKRPGELTLDYLAGRRVRYVHPLRLFLFTSAICLAFIQYFGGSPVLMKYQENAPAKKANRGPDWDFRMTDASPTPAAAATSPAASTAEPTPAAAPTAEPARPASPTRHRDDADPDDDDNPVKGLADELSNAADKVRQAGAEVKERASANASPSANEGFGDQIARRAKARVTADGGPAQMQKEITANVQRRVSWVALALLPIFAVMLRSLYWRRDSFYFAHFVFSLHYHTFLLLFVAAYTLLELVLPTSFWPVHTLLRLSLLFPGVYLFLALRRIYGEEARRTILKVVVLGTMHLCVLIISLAIVGAWAFYRAL